MESSKYSDIKDEEKVLFKARITINPRSKNAEVADSYITEESIAIHSSEPLQIPLDRVEDCSLPA